MNETEQNNIILKIKEIFPNEKIQIKKYKSGKLELWFKEKNSMMKILQENTWDEIKRNITAHLTNDKSTICSICSTEDAIKLRRIFCNKCASNWCIDCYINIFRTNKGLIKCPFCRFTYGRQVPDYAVELGVQEILGTL